jgi:hypothetical protein
MVEGWSKGRGGKSKRRESGEMREKKNENDLDKRVN